MFRLAFLVLSLDIAVGQCIPADALPCINELSNVSVTTNYDKCVQYYDDAIECLKNEGNCNPIDPEWAAAIEPYNATIHCAGIVCSNAAITEAQACQTAQGTVPTAYEACQAYWNNITACWSNCSTDISYTNSTAGSVTAGLAACVSIAPSAAPSAAPTTASGSVQNDGVVAMIFAVIGCLSAL